MDYKKHYDLLIEHANTRTISGYVEKHHILPKSLGGSDNKDNLVRLTGREHFVAHLLLHKIHGCSITAFALWMMQCKSHKNDGRPHIKNSRMYDWARKEFKKHVIGHQHQTGKKNSQYGTMWISNIEMRQNKKILKEDPIPSGWVRGRVINFDKPKKSTKEDRWNRHKIKYEKIATELFNEFKNSGCSSANEFCKSGFYDKSVVSLTQLWLKYIPEYRNNSKQGKNSSKIYASQALK